MSDDEKLISQLGLYLSQHFGCDVGIKELSRIPGGASRQTYRFVACYAQGSELIERVLILRRDPAFSLIETERMTEFSAYRAFHKAGLPVPEPIVLELGSAALERPFFIMEAIEGCSAGSLLAADPYGSHRELIGQQFWSALGRIAGSDPIALGLGDLERADDSTQCGLHELARWEQVIREDSLEPQPIALGAIRWLRRHPPPPPSKLCVVHGDYRSGNFLHDGEGHIRAILDWEMAHLGDPLEDLAWALDPLWSHGNPHRPGGMISRDAALRIWQEESGLVADARALGWWEIFSQVKGLAIWISAAREFSEGRNTEGVNAFSGLYCTAFHNRTLSERILELHAS
ncbi:MAG: phosphotransferase family protein [Alphaproteobacteria bacterium]|nr:phosphotransferase family protein [Alphaproteobacteria bacterium]